MRKLNEVAKKASNLFSLTVNVKFDKTIEKYVVMRREKILYIGEKNDCTEFLRNNTIPFMVRHAEE